MERNVKGLLLRKTWFCRKEKFKKCTSFERQKGTRYIRGNVYVGIIFLSCVSSTKSCLRFSLDCFAREKKGFYNSCLGDEVDFRDTINVSLKCYPRIKISKIWQSFEDERAMITTAFLSMKALLPFYLWKKRLKTHL